MSDDPDLTDRGAYQFWSREKLRFSDTDMIGHVNNVAFAALIESGRVGFTRSGVIDGLPRGLLVVMRRIELDYRAELHWPADIDVGSRRHLDHHTCRDRPCNPPPRADPGRRSCPAKQGAALGKKSLLF
jgi:hypothetical protein